MSFHLVKLHSISDLSFILTICEELFFHKFYKINSQNFFFHKYFFTHFFIIFILTDQVFIGCQFFCFLINNKE